VFAVILLVVIGTNGGIAIYPGLDNMRALVVMWGTFIIALLAFLMVLHWAIRGA
jgi:ABC-type proline/glycine betaine transport system permease subunit